VEHQIKSVEVAAFLPGTPFL